MPVPLITELYHALLIYPCRCTYKRVNDIPFWESGRRVLEAKCGRCRAIERYRDEVGIGAEKDNGET